MSELAAMRATNAEVTSLAATIKSAQGPEVTIMSGWLVGWGKSVPASGSSMAMGGGTGMMSAADMTKLGAAMGASFDRMWVQMMVQHHEGAVAMAKTELAQGQNSLAHSLAQSIITSQTAQIEQLKTLLTTLAG